MEGGDGRVDVEEIKSLVKESLMAEGTLPRVKAQLRAAVFNIAERKEEDGYQEDESNLFSTEEDFIACCLVKDFLSHYGLKYTESVFIAEASVHDSMSNEDVKEQLSLTKDNQPMLIEVVSNILREK